MNLETLESRVHTLWRKAWPWFLFVSFIAGIFLRMTFVQDMEYKEDEQYNFNQSQWIGNSQPWPWYGIPSGVYLVNPGMSIWVFAGLAKLFGIHTPTGLANAVQAFALLGIFMVIPFALRFIHRIEERRLWLWAFALACVNPFLVLYQRKLWPEPFLPFFTILTLMGWWKRSDPVYGKRFSFLWGLVGAWLGQIHMSGFFFSAALFTWTLFFEKKSRTPWLAWFLGSVLGALPLIPWAMYVMEHPVQERMATGWVEMIQLKYWVFWLTDPTGLHLGNPLGLLRGPSHWDQLSDFVRYPIVAGVPTYLTGVFHVIALGAVVFIYGRGLFNLRRLFKQDTPTGFLINSAFLGCGLMMTLTGVVIRRYYMAVTFPLEFVFLVRAADPESRTGRIALVALWAAQLAISANFVGYIHVNQGSTQGDYGPAYHLVAPGAAPSETH